MKKNNIDFKTSSYGFIDGSQLPCDDYYMNQRLDYKDIEWAVMYKFNDIANNHCAATLITNLCIYFQKQGYSGLLIDNSIRKTFEYIHQVVGNGPVFTTAKAAKRYFAKCGYLLNYRMIYNYESIKEAIDLGMPIGILLAEKPFEWHWVLGVGYLESSDKKFIWIINAWQNSDDSLYMLNHGSKFISAVKYSVKAM